MHPSRSLSIPPHSSHRHSFIPDHYMSRSGVCFHARTYPERRQPLHRPRALEGCCLRTVGFPSTLTHLCIDWFTHYVLFIYLFSYFLLGLLMVRITVSSSGTLVSGTRACCTRHPRLPLELTRSLKHSPRLPDAP